MTAPLSPSDLAEIEAVAKAATPGPWRWAYPGSDVPELTGMAGDENYSYETEVIEARHSGGCGCRSACELHLEVSNADAAHIARMDPATTLALLAWGKRAEDAVARVRELLDPPSTKSDDGCMNCGDRRLQHVGQVDGGECRLCGFCGGFKPRLPDVSRDRILAALDADAAAGGAG